MSTVEDVIEDLRALAPAQLESAAHIVRQLRRHSAERSRAMLKRTAGALTPAEGEAMEQVIREIRRI